MSREKELEIVEAATQGRWKLTPTGVVAEDGALLAFAQLDANNKFIATFNPARVRELLDENYEVTRLLAERDLKLNYANKRIHRLESRLDAVERIADAIEEHDAPFEAFPTAQWVRKAVRGE